MALVLGLVLGLGYPKPKPNLGPGPIPNPNPIPYPQRGARSAPSADQRAHVMGVVWFSSGLAAV